MQGHRAQGHSTNQRNDHIERETTIEEETINFNPTDNHDIPIISRTKTPSPTPDDEQEPNNNPMIPVNNNMKTPEKQISSYGSDGNKRNINPNLFLSRTPATSEEKEKYPFFCPICMHHYRKGVYVTKCCNNSICYFCHEEIMEFEKQKTYEKIERLAELGEQEEIIKLNATWDKIDCIFCRQPGMVLKKAKKETTRNYLENSPIKKLLNVLSPSKNRVAPSPIPANVLNPSNTTFLEPKIVRSNSNLNTSLRDSASKSSFSSTRSPADSLSTPSPFKHNPLDYRSRFRDLQEEQNEIYAQARKARRRKKTTPQSSPTKNLSKKLFSDFLKCFLVL